MRNLLPPIIKQNDGRGKRMAKQKDGRYRAKMMKYMNANEIAENLRSADSWDAELCAVLCEEAGMTAEWEAADGDTFESVVEAAAAKLGVEIY